MKHYTIRAIRHSKPFESQPLALLCCNHLMHAHEEKRIFIHAFCLMPDHLHLFVGAKPTVTPFKIIHKLKGNTSIQLRRCFPELMYLGYKQHFGKGFDNLWARGYYCGSAGHVSQEQVKRYIQEQMGKSVFDYDIYGCPTHLKGQLKIGDFKLS